MQTCLHADEDFCIAEAQQYMWPTGQIAQKPSAMQEAEGKCKLVCMQTRTFVLPRREQYMWPTGQNIVKLAHVLMDFRGTMQREVLSSEFIVQAFNIPIRSCITL